MSWQFQRSVEAHVCITGEGRHGEGVLSTHLGCVGHQQNPKGRPMGRGAWIPWCWDLSASLMVSGRTLLLLWIWMSRTVQAVSELLTKSPFFVCCCCVCPSFLLGKKKQNKNNWCVSLIIPRTERPILASSPLCLWLLVSAFWEKRDYPTSFHILITCIFNSSLVFPWEKLFEHRSLVKSRYRIAEKTTLREGVCVCVCVCVWILTWLVSGIH